MSLPRCTQIHPFMRERHTAVLFFWATGGSAYRTSSSLRRWNQPHFAQGMSMRSPESTVDHLAIGSKGIASGPRAKF